MRPAARRAGSCLLLLAAVCSACSYGDPEVQSNAYAPYVFPGEARLGASVLMVIDSNQFGIGDQLERYDLHRDRVRILVEGNLGTAPANLRSVFAIESGQATLDAELRRNAWMMVALFDLPDETSGAFSAPYPQHVPLSLEVDDQIVPEIEGLIWVIGEGGEPTSLDAAPLLPSFEEELEPQTMVRLRAKSDGTSGFQTSWVIGGMSAEIEYDPDCLENPRAHAGSEAIGAGLIVGPSTPAANPSLLRTRLVLSHPKGLQLPVGGTIDPSRLGAGPILDLVFDRTGDTECTDALDSYFWVRSLTVRERDGTLRVSRPAPEEEGFDGSEFFHFHFVDPERPS